ncbi:Dr1-associated corepressor [Plakobranchus ocellatus]|uniref:Dr1-associated corepressor n=1 Tax=Plakobranchus ocellatus TaxID=259542 RepID=A0AAV3XWF9_9GAST|nr:Dr1-associated corepressor [Plakobranchus ocellatus]
MTALRALATAARTVSDRGLAVYPSLWQHYRRLTALKTAAMPKTPSRTSKKKKFNSRFPPARIKKIMQTDEEVGKVAAAVPVIISRALELFIESLIKETSRVTMTRNAKTLSTSHIKHTIETNKQFDFLRDLVANVPDHNTEESNGDTIVEADNGDIPQKRKRGRPRKIKEPLTSGNKSRGKSSKASSDTSEDDEEEEEEEDEDEDSESDDNNKTSKVAESSSYLPAKSSATKPIGVSNSGASSDSHTAAHHNSGPSSVNTADAQKRLSQFPPGYCVPTLASVQNQQQQLQLYQQMQAHQQPPHQHQQQQQHNIGSISSLSSSHPPSYLPPKALSTHSPYTTNSIAHPSGVESYPIPPQFHNSHVIPGVVTPAHQPLPSPLGSSRHPAYPGPIVPPAHNALSSQMHPINLSVAAKRSGAVSQDADDYDS